MTDSLLQIQGLKVGVEGKEILHGIHLTIRPGETHVLMGPNGAGKSTLGFALMGSPRHEVTEGSVLFGGRQITHETADKRARQGLFLSFQNPLEVPGLTLGSFIRSALEQRRGVRIGIWEFKKELKRVMDLLQMEESYADRDLNVGFSGGEKKKAEILQLLMLKPRLAILDETDSGLDVEEFVKDKTRALLIITHSTRILEALSVDRTHVMVDGRIVKTGDASLVKEINDHGFEAYMPGSL